MANSLEVTKYIDGTDKFLSFKLTNASSLPKPIFIMENVGTTTLINYQGVCTFNELFGLQEFTGTAIPVLNNKYVRVQVATVKVPYNVDELTIIQRILQGISLLNTEYIAGSSVSVTNFPVP